MKWINLIIFNLALSSCVGSIGAGSLGGWKTIVFPVNEMQMDLNVKELCKQYPQYVVPMKWKYEADYWNSPGYNSLKAMFFYFKASPEEMYYVTFIGAGYNAKNPEWARIAIRAVYTEKAGWKQNEKFSDQEKTRIDKRFNDEIISKLEAYSKTKSHSEK